MIDLDSITQRTEQWYDHKVSDADFATDAAAKYLPELVAEVKRLRNPSPPRSLTKRQSQILVFLFWYTQKNGYSPTLNEIAKEFRFASLATCHEHLGNLERKGWISRAFNEERGITVLHQPAGVSQ